MTGILDKYVNSDFDMSFLQQANEQEHNTLLSSTPNSCKVKQPTSPANSYDSGVGSPGSDISSVLLGSDSSTVATNFLNEPEHLDEAVISQAVASNFFSFPLHHEEHAIADAAKESLEQVDLSLVSDIFSLETSATESSTLDFNGTSHIVAEDFTHTPSVIGNNASARASLPNSSFEDTKNVIHSSIPASTSDASQVSSFPTVSGDISTLALSEFPSLSSLSNFAPTASASSSSSSARSRCGRKSKVTTLEEKKQRKRDQNKHAATRYRERKRQETQEREGEYKTLETRNKELKDKLLRIRSEMNYLKDLMIEVYTIKGLIS